MPLDDGCYFLSACVAIIQVGQELSAKPFSLLSTNPHPLRMVVLKEDLLMMKATIR
jgi:hypothetical protein